MKNSIIKLLSPLAAVFCILSASIVYGQNCPDQIQSTATIVVTPEQCYEANDGQLEISFVNAVGNYDPSLGSFEPAVGDYLYGLFDGGPEGGWVYDEARITPGDDVVASIAISYTAPNIITFTGLPPNRDIAGYRVYIFNSSCTPGGRREFAPALGAMVDPATEVIIDPAQISVTDNTVCAPPTPFDGVINMTGAVSGGAGGYQYSIDGTTFQTNPVFSGLEHNTYTITVVDQNSTTVGDNCTKTVEVTVGNAQVPLTPAISPVDPTVCSGVDVPLNGTPSGGTGNYVTHTWTGDTGPLSATSVVDPTFNAAAAGTYNLTYEVTDDKGCTATSSITITVNNSPTDAVLSGDATICAGNSTNLSVAITDGVAPFSFNILDNTTATTFAVSNYTNGDAISVSPATTTSYSIDGVVTDANGCEVPGTGNAVVTVVDPSDVTLTTEAEDANICAGEATNIIVRSSENGYTYQLRNDADDSPIGTPVNGDGSDILLPTGNLSATTTFNVLVSNGALCPDTELDNTVPVNVTDVVDLTLPVNAENDPICSGEATNILVDNSETGVTYQLRNDADDSNVGPTQAGTGGLLSFPTGVLTTTTTYHVVASNGVCADAELTTVARVNVNPTPTAAVLSGDATLCAGDATDLFVTITDGVGPFNFSISDGANTLAVTNYTNGDPISVSPTANATYTLDGNVVDASGCQVSGSGSAVVSVNQGPTAASISGGTTLCEGEATTLQVTATGGVAPYSFTLSDGTAVSNYNSGDNIPVTPTATTSYTVATLRDFNGCEVAVSGSADVTLHPLPTAFDVSPSHLAICSTDAATVNLDGSQSGVTYEMYLDGTATGQTTAGTGAPLMLTLPGGSFTNGQVISVHAVNNTTLCEAPMSGSSTIDISTIQAYGIASPGSTAACDGDVVTVDLADSEVGVTYELLRNGVGTGVLVNGTGAAISFDRAVTGADDGQPLSVIGRRGSCEQPMTGNTTLAVNTITANAGIAQSIPENTNTTLSGNASDGSGNYAYAWTSSPANQITPGEETTQNPTTVNLTVATDFTLTVTDNITGCTDTETVRVNVTGGILTVTATAAPATVCAGEEVALEATPSNGDGTYSYLWDNGATDPAPRVNPMVTTTYEVTVTDGSGATATDQVIVTVNPLPTEFTLVPSANLPVCTGANATITLPDSESDVTYTLYKNGAATLVSANGANGTALPFTLNYGNFAGGDVLTVHARNNTTMCEAIMDGSVTIQINDPQTYAVSAVDTEVCSGEDAVIRLSDSQSGVDYEVLMDGTLIATIPGSDNALVINVPFVDLIDGQDLTIRANNGSCTVDMTGSAMVSISTITVADAGTDASVCADSYTLAANDANTVTANETGTWTVTSGTGVFSNVNDPLATVSGLTPGNNIFKWTIIDNNGVCSFTEASVTVTYRIVTPAAVGANQTVCEDQTILSANSPVAGETGTWTVTGGTGVVDNANDPNTQVTGLSVGANEFTWTISDNSGTCPSTTASTTLTRNQLTVEAGLNQSIATGTTATLGGTASNGIGPYAYQWEPAGLLVDATIANPTTLPLTNSTLFTLTVTDGGVGTTCQASDQVLVTVTGGVLSVTASANGSETPIDLCEGTLVNLSALASGGDGAYTYTWTSANGTVITHPDHTAASATASPTATETFTIRIEDGNGEVITDDVEVVVHPLPLPFTIGPDPTIVCSTTDAILMLDGSEPTVTYELLRNNSAVGLPPVTGDGNALRFTLPQGELASNDEWTIRAESASGCIRMMLGQATIQISNPVAYTINGPLLTVCQGQAATITLNNSDTGVTYTLLSGGSAVATLPGATGTRLDFVLADGSFADEQVYTIEADNGSCQVTMTGSVEIDLVGLDATFAYPNSGNFCADGSNQFPVPGYNSGGKFTALPAGLSIDEDSGEIDMFGSSANVYTVSYELTSGACTDTKTFSVTINNATADPTFSYSAASFCTEAGATESIILDPGASAGEFSYTVLSGSGTLSVATDGTIDLENSTPGSYQVNNLIRGAGGSCADAVHRVNIQVLEPEVADVVYSATVFCQSDATDPVPTNNGTLGGIFSTTDPIVIDPDNGAIDLSASTPGGPYTITYTTPGTCKDMLDITDLFIDAATDARFSYLTNQYCIGSGSILPDNVATTPGTFSANLPGLRFVDAATGEIDLTTSDAGSYVITYVPNAPGTCNGSETFNLTLYDVTATAGPDERACSLTHYLLGSTPTGDGASGEWTLVNSPSGTATATFANYADPNSEVRVSELGTYTFRWTVRQGTCMVTDEVDIEFVDTFTITSYGVGRANGCGQNDGSIAVNLAGGSSMYSYDWSVAGNDTPLPSGIIRRGLPSGVHSVLISDDILGCDTLLVFQIGNKGIDSKVSITPTATSCDGGNTGEAEVAIAINGIYTITVTDATGVARAPITYDSNGGAAATITGLARGEYSLEIEGPDVNGDDCKTGHSVEITGVPPISVAPDKITGASCIGVEDGLIEITVSGGTPTEFIWRDASGNEVSRLEDPNLTGGNYTVDITYGGGSCVGTFGPYSVYAPLAANGPVADVPFSADIQCNSFEARWSDESVTEYRIDVATDAAFTTLIVADQLVNATNYTVSGPAIAAGTDYFYRVRAVNAGCISQNSNVVQVTTKDVAVPVADQATDLSCDGFTAHWSEVPGATYYLTVIDGTNAPVPGFTDLPVAAGITEQLVNGLNSGETYQYHVVAEPACGLSDPSGNRTATTLGSSATMTIQTIDPTCAEATIEWSGVSGVTTYEIATYLDPARTIPVSLPAQPTRIVSTMEVTLAGLNQGTTYYFTVTAQYPCSTITAEGEFDTDPDPAAPTRVVADASCDELNLQWDAVPGATGYEVDVDITAAFSAPVSLTVTGTDATFTGMDQGRQYFYQVRTSDGCGVSTYTTGDVTTTNTPTTPANVTASTPACNGFTVRWDAVDGATGYTVQASADGFVTFEEMTVTDPEATFISLLVETIYEYRVLATNGCTPGTSPFSTPGTLATSPEEDCGCGFDKATFVVDPVNENCPTSKDGALLVNLLPNVSTSPARFRYRYYSLTNPADSSADWESGANSAGLVWAVSNRSAGDYLVNIRDTNAQDACDSIKSFNVTIRTQNQIAAVTKGAMCDIPGEIVITIPSTCLGSIAYSVSETTGGFSATDADGKWTFAELPAGDYRIAIKNFLTNEPYDTLSLTVPNNCTVPPPTEPTTVCNLDGGVTFLPETTLAACETGEGSVTFTALNETSETFTFTVIEEGGIVFDTQQGNSGITFDNLPSRRYTYEIYDALSQFCRGTFTVGTKSVSFEAAPSQPITCNDAVTRIEVVIDTDATLAAGPYDVLLVDRTNTIAQTSVPLGASFASFPDVPVGSQYGVIVRPAAEDACATRKTVDTNPPGTTAIQFAYQLDSTACFQTRGGGALTVNRIVVDDNEPFTAYLYRVDIGEEEEYARRKFSTAPQSIYFEDIENGEYQIRLVQQQSGCVSTTQEKRSETILIAGPEKTLTASVRSYVEVTVNYPYGTIEVDSIAGGGAPYEVRIAADPTGASTEWTEVINGNPIVRPYRHEYRDRPVGTYYIEVRDRFGCVFSRTVEVGYTSDLYIPNIFTPNGDGQNDTFYILNLENYGENAGIRMKITNRWGVEVYQSPNYTNVEAWDGGTYPDGIYYYYMVLPDNTEHTGWLEIWRGRTP